MNEAMYAALKAAQSALEAQTYKQDQPIIPWLETETVKTKAEWKRDWDQAYAEVTGAIVNMEIADEDPIQRQERIAEFQAALAFDGIKDDVSLYVHTPEQERQFQRRIEDQVLHGYWDESGWNEGLDGDYEAPFACMTCGMEIWSDEVMSVANIECCDSCVKHVDALILLLATIRPDLFTPDMTYN